MFVFLKMYHLLNKTGDGYIYHKYVSLSLCDLLFNPKRVRECNTVLNGWHAYLLNRKGNGFCCGESPQVSDQLHLPLTSFHLQRHKRSIWVPPTTTNQGHIDIRHKVHKLYTCHVPRPKVAAGMSSRNHLSKESSAFSALAPVELSCRPKRINLPGNSQHTEHVWMLTLTVLPCKIVQNSIQFSTIWDSLNLMLTWIDIFFKDSICITLTFKLSNTLYIYIFYKLLAFTNLRTIFWIPKYHRLQCVLLMVTK